MLFGGVRCWCGFSGRAGAHDEPLKTGWGELSSSAMRLSGGSLATLSFGCPRDSRRDLKLTTLNYELLAVPELIAVGH